ncbi:MAG: DUF4149 domain-containing protein [Gammaproteobacteria bacterium]|nr:DUF4149 domain-containing protein [Gammaproteobacteria bacterium]
MSSLQSTAWPERVERALLTLWIGGMWVTGFIVAPVLFKSLDDRLLAGNIAGQLFHITSYIGIVTVLLITAMAVVQYGKDVFRLTHIRIILVMLLLTLVGEFVLTPMMVALKADPIAQSLIAVGAHSRFSMLHGISSSLFLLNSVLGLVLVAKIK